MDSFEDQLLQIEDDFEAKFSALKSFTLSTLGEERKRNVDFERRLTALEVKMEDISMTDFGKFDESFSTIREEIQELRDSRVEAAQEVNEPPLKKANRASTSIPVNLHDIGNEELKSEMANFYVEKPSPVEKLSPAQLAFVFFWLHKKGGSSGKMHFRHLS